MVYGSEHRAWCKNATNWQKCSKYFNMGQNTFNHESEPTLLPTNILQRCNVQNIKQNTLLNPCIFMFIETESAHGRTVSAVHPTANHTLWYASFRTHLNQERGHSVLPAARHVQSTAVCPSSLHLSRSTPVPLANPMGAQLQTRQARLCSIY